MLCLFLQALLLLVGLSLAESEAEAEADAQEEAATGKGTLRRLRLRRPRPVSISDPDGIAEGRPIPLRRIPQGKTIPLFLLHRKKIKERELGFVYSRYSNQSLKAKIT